MLRFCLYAKAISGMPTMDQVILIFRFRSDGRPKLCTDGRGAHIEWR